MSVEESDSMIAATDTKGAKQSDQIAAEQTKRIDQLEITMTEQASSLSQELSQKYEAMQQKLVHTEKMLQSFKKESDHQQVNNDKMLQTAGPDFKEAARLMEIVSRGLSYDFRHSQIHFNPTKIAFNEWVQLKDPLGESDITKLYRMTCHLPDILKTMRPMTIPMF